MRPTVSLKSIALGGNQSFPVVSIYLIINSSTYFGRKRCCFKPSFNFTQNRADTGSIIAKKTAVPYSWISPYYSHVALR